MRRCRSSILGAGTLKVIEGIQLCPARLRWGNQLKGVVGSCGGGGGGEWEFRYGGFFFSLLL